MLLLPLIAHLISLVAAAAARVDSSRDPSSDIDDILARNVAYCQLPGVYNNPTIDCSYNIESGNGTGETNYTVTISPVLENYSSWCDVMQGVIPAMCNQTWTAVQQVLCNDSWIISDGDTGLKYELEIQHGEVAPDPGCIHNAITSSLCYPGLNLTWIDGGCHAGALSEQ